MAPNKVNQLDYISYLYAIAVLLGGIFGFLKAGNNKVEEKIIYLVLINYIGLQVARCHYYPVWRLV